MLKTECYIEITPSSVVLNGQQLPVSEQGETLLVALYRKYVGDYPKFFKMDTLCRLGFIAAEMLLKQSDISCQPSAVILANRSASIKNDKDYLATITEGNYYPSPSLFVYTLPNIVTGEIAIRHHIQGETSFYILDTPEQLELILCATLRTQGSPVLAGWCECSDKNTFYANIQILWNN